MDFLYVVGPIALGLVTGLIFGRWGLVTPVLLGILTWVAIPDSDDVPNESLALVAFLLVAAGVALGYLLRGPKAWRSPGRTR